MSDCRRTAERLPSYVDRMLDERERADVERHLAECPPCRDEAVREETGRTALRQCAEHLRGEPLPPGLRTRCEALARTHAEQRQGPRRGWVRAWPARLALGAAAAIAMVVLFSEVSHRSNALLAAQLTADHAKCFGLFGGEETSADAGSVQQRLLAQYGWDVHVPPSTEDGSVQLVGGRRCLWADGRIPHIMYRINGEHVSLFVLDGVALGSAEVVVLGHRSRIWSRGQTTYVLVSHAETKDVTDGADYVMREAR